MDTNQWIAFCQDWNAGLTAKELAVKYGASVPTVRNWVASLRKKGVNLKKRTASHLEIDVAAVNRKL